MFSKNNNAQTVWVGLSFLAVGLIIGLLFANGGSILSRSDNSDSGDQGSTVPEVDVDSLEVVDVSVDDDPYLGDENAPVTIVEFSDFQCPYCRAFYDETYAQLKENYIDTGKVKLVYRDFPLSGHAQANLAARAAECVAKQQSATKNNENYFAYHDWLFENVSLWSGQEDAEEILITAAKDNLGLDIRTCVANGETADEVNADLTAGRGYGVTGTPSFFINGKKLVGAWPYEIFEKVIESEL